MFNNIDQIVGSLAGWISILGFVTTIMIRGYRMSTSTDPATAMPVMRSNADWSVTRIVVSMALAVGLAFVSGLAYWLLPDWGAPRVASLLRPVALMGHIAGLAYVIGLLATCVVARSLMSAVLAQQQRAAAEAAAAELERLRRRVAELEAELRLRC